MWEKIIEAYRALPEHEQTPEHVALHLDAEGQPDVGLDRIQHVLQALVVAEIPLDAIATTTRTLQVLGRVSMRWAEPEPAEREFVDDLLAGLMEEANGQEVEELTDALASIITAYESLRRNRTGLTASQSSSP